MRTKVVVAAIGVLILAAGGGYYGLDVYPQQRFRAGLDQTLATLPPGTAATFKDAQYSVLSHQAVVTGLTVRAEIAGPSPQRIDITIESIETTNPNLDFSDSWNKALANKSSLTADMPLPIANSIVAKGVTVRSTAINMTEDSVRIDHLRIYPWALLHDGMPSLKEFQAALTTMPQPPALTDLQPLLRAEVIAMQGVAYDGYAAGTLKVSATLPGLDFAYEVNRMTGRGFDRGILKGGTAEGIAIKATKTGAVSVDRVAMSETDVREPMTRIVNGEALSPVLLNGIKIGRIEYVGVTVQPPDKPSVHVGAFSIGPVAFAQGLPVSGTLAFQDIGVSRSQLPDPKAQDAFTKLGLETITLSLALSYDWDVAQRRATIHDTMLKVNDLGTTTISANLTNVDASVAALTQARLAHAGLRFEDASLVERLLRAGAAQTGADPAAYRQQIAGMVQHLGVTPGQDSPLLATAQQAASDFITSPHSLTIELSPPVPVTFMALQRAVAAPANFAAMVGLAVSANRP